MLALPHRLRQRTRFGSRDARSARSIIAIVVACTALGALPAAATVRSPQTPAQAVPHLALPMTPWPGTAQPPATMHWSHVTASPYLAVAVASKRTVAYLWMDTAHLRFRFIPGYLYPEHSPRTAADHNAATWVPSMVAAFTGAFMLKDKHGGYFYRGHTVAPLQRGLASLVGMRDGSLRLGSWGTDVTMSSDVLVVRQNLKPLVRNGQSLVAPTDGKRTWGYAINDAARVNRSALALLPDGSLVFVFARLATPAQLAQRVLATGATFAMALDMNYLWPAAYVYTHAKGKTTGKAISPYVVHPWTQFLDTNKKDFIVVESTTATGA